MPSHVRLFVLAATMRDAAMNLGAQLESLDCTLLARIFLCRRASASITQASHFLERMATTLASCVLFVLVFCASVFSHAVCLVRGRHVFSVWACLEDATGRSHSQLVDNVPGCFVVAAALAESVVEPMAETCCGRRKT